MLDGVVHRLLADPQELGLHLGAQPRRALVDGHLDRDAGHVAQVPRQPAEARAEALAGPDLGAQGQHGAAYLRHDAADPQAQVRQLVALLLGGRLRGERVDGVAEVGDVLGDAVVHLARPAAALLGGGLVLQRGEQQSGVEPDRVGTSSSGRR